MRGQIWIETVLYTLIGFSLMAMILAYAYPKIQAGQERALIEQSIQMSDTLYATTQDVLTRGPGNVKTIQLAIKKGALIIAGMNDSISFSVDELHSVYSQPNASIQLGVLTIRTLETAGRYRTEVMLPYNKTLINITNAGVDSELVLTSAPSPYTIRVSNEGGNPVQLSLEVLS